MSKIEKITRFEMDDGKGGKIDLTKHVKPGSIIYISCARADGSTISITTSQLKRLDEKYKKVLAEIVSK